ncbi:MAG: SDR family NAD(P)-dependent oxidoreductase [Betaproteobacteria bacterium]|nr:SDR family NAD(P)-dependent oxidoreductase [Betaproteobacteria bacterium]
MTALPLQSRVILVTGASSGLGKHAALALAAQGATVLLLGRNENRLNAVYDRIVENGGAQPAVIPFDLAAADDARFHALARTIEQQTGRLDGLLHSASHFIPLAPLATQSLKDWQAGFATNLFAPFALTKACLPLLQAAPDASVLFTVEQHGLEPAAYWGGFGVSQAALVALAKTFAEEETAHPSLRFNVMVPGPVATPMRNRTHPGEVGSLLPQPAGLMPAYCYWLGPESAGRSGEIIRL